MCPPPPIIDLPAPLYTYKLQKRAARILANSDYSVRSSQIFQKFSWKPIDLILKKRDLFMTFKVINDMLPEYTIQLFNTCESTEYGLRSSNLKLFKLNQKLIF